MNIFELKSSITKNLKNSVNELSIRMEREEERNTELEGRTIEITQSKQQKENNRLWGEKKQAWGSAEPNKISKIHGLRVSEREEKKGGDQEILEEMTAKIFPNLAKGKNLQLQIANSKQDKPKEIYTRTQYSQISEKAKKKNLKSSERNNTLHIGGKNSNDCEFLMRNHGGQKEMTKYFSSAEKITDNTESLIQHNYPSGMKEKLTFSVEG